MTIDERIAELRALIEADRRVVDGYRSDIAELDAQTEAALKVIQVASLERVATQGSIHMRQVAIEQRLNLVRKLEAERDAAPEPIAEKLNAAGLNPNDMLTEEQRREFEQRACVMSSARGWRGW